MISVACIIFMKLFYYYSFLFVSAERETLGSYEIISLELLQVCFSAGRIDYG